MDISKEHKVWDRSGIKDDDELNFYLTSLYYDCSFSISNSDERGPEIFKCHKFVLARASTVFEKMLLGFFQESSKGRDDAIGIASKISPEAFDLAMRFLYGNRKEFRSCKLAVELNYFAHEWMITSLSQAAAEFLRREQGPDDVLFVMDMYLILGVEAELESCLKIVREKTHHLFVSTSWALASEKTMLTIYKSKQLNASELSLFLYLVIWGIAQVKTQEKRTKETVTESLKKRNDRVREKINECLMHIRFRALNPTSMVKLFASKFFSITFSDGEKFQILRSLHSNSLGAEILLPPNFALEASPRNLSEPVKLALGFNSELHKRSKLASGGPFSFSFLVQKEGMYIEGVHLFSLNYANKGKPISLVCTLEKFSSVDHLLGKISFDGISNKDENYFIAFDAPIALEMGSTVTMRIQYKINETKCATCTYSVAKFPIGCGLHYLGSHPAESKIVDVIGLRISKDMYSYTSHDTRTF